MRSREVINRLQADGWVHVRTQGSHHHFKKAGIARLVTVPHPKKSIPTGTLRSIFRLAGWPWPPN